MQNKTEQSPKAKRLAQAKKSVYKQALLAGFVILLTVVLVFASITAWYTNVAHTSGLVFEVASWGFTGTVEAENDPVQAGPGDSGNVYFSAQNDSENVVDVSVTVTKPMAEEMRKRLYFYVDTPATRAGETMSRTYINSAESYTYKVFPMGNLTLTKQFHNDAQLKWAWVYDLLGYYVKGTMGTDGVMTVEEYLRPIEYEYDEAKTVFAYPDEDNTKAKELVSIDGTVAVDEFLIELSKTDGYDGNINPDNKQNGWYPVVVDEDTGAGVWAYLCNYSEIEMATLWDTQQGELAAQAKIEDSGVEAPTYTARLNISAEKSELTTTVVSTAAALKEAVTSPDTAVIRLAQNLSVETMDIPENKTLVLDLNGNTLTAAGAYLMTTNAGSNVTVLDGALKADSSTAIFAKGGEVTLSNVTADGVKRLVTVQDNYGDTDSKIRLIGCTVNATESAVHLTGNGEVSERLTQLVVEDCTIYGDYMGIVGNGNSYSCGTDTTIINSTVEGKWAGVYHPQKDSFMTITGSTIIGNTGLALKGGQTTVIDSVITGTGEHGITEPVYSNSGFADTGDGIYLETNYEWAVSAQVYGTSVVKGGTKVAAEVTNTTLAVRIYEPADDASVRIYGGTFNSNVTAFAGNGTTCTSTGTEWTVELVQE